MDDADEVRRVAGDGMQAAAAVLLSTCERIGYRPKPATNAVACIGLLALLATVWTVGLPSLTVAVPSATVPPTVTTVRGDYWISSARGKRARIHRVECSYHRLQTNTDGAAQRRYYPSLTEAQTDCPHAERCRRCLGD